MVIEFKKPYTFDGNEYKEINIDLDSLTGADLLRVGKQYKKEGNSSPMKTLDETYHVMVAAKASGQKVEFFENLPAPEFVKVTTEVMAFLTGTD